MPRYFLDSSALVKRYHRESGSADVDALFGASRNRCLISRLALVEVQSTFMRLVRERVLAQSDFTNLVARLTGDVAGGAFMVAAVSGRLLDQAAAILQTNGTTHPIRTLDAIHLATGLSLNARRPLAAFVAADKRLLAAAAACGLPVLETS
jgi:predicted nucleic acid-binding protein